MKKIVTLLFTFTLNTLAFSQYIADGPKIVAPDGLDLTGDGVIQGSDVFLSHNGTTLLFSSPYDSLEYGACWVYTRDANGWNYQTKLVPDSVDGAAQITDAAINFAGNRIAMGGGANNFGEGAVWIFELQGSTWVRTQKITVQNGIGNARFGTSVALSPDGSTLIAGGAEDNNLNGAVWAFAYNGSAYMETQKILPNDNTGLTNFGASVSIAENGNRFAVSGPLDNTYIGAVWIFDKDVSGTWLQIGSKLVANDYLDTSPFFGSSIALAPQGDVLAVGAQNNDVTSNNGIGPKGGSWIFSLNGTTWSQTTPRILGTGAQPLHGNHQGISIATSYSGDTLAVGGYGDEDGEGSVWIFIRNGNNWIQSGNKINPDDEDNGAFGAHFGTSLSMDYSGQHFAAGGASDANYLGATWIYKTASPQGIAQWPAHSASLVYLNSTHTLSWTAVNTDAFMKLYDVAGRLLFQEAIDSKTNAMQLPVRFSKGVFLVSIVAVDGNMIAKGKFVTF